MVKAIWFFVSFCSQLPVELWDNGKRRYVACFRKHIWILEDQKKAVKALYITVFNRRLQKS